MLKKRLIGVITVRQGIAVQSLGYHRYLPLGKPECIAENLDRWGVDEILIQDIGRSLHGLGPNIELIEKVCQENLATPVVYAGGVISKSDAVNVIRSGAERVSVDALLRKSPDEIKNIADSLGTQAVMATLPFVGKADGAFEWYCYQTQRSDPLSKDVKSLISNGYISELIVVDKNHEGVSDGFDLNLLEEVENLGVPLILFGGLNNTAVMEKAFARKYVSGVALGNFLNYKEHSVQKFKEKLASSPIRTSYYHARSFK